MYSDVEMQICINIDVLLNMAVMCAWGNLRQVGNLHELRPNLFPHRMSKFINELINCTQNFKTVKMPAVFLQAVLPVSETLLALVTFTKICSPLDPKYPDHCGDHFTVHQLMCQ